MEGNAAKQSSQISSFLLMLLTSLGALLLFLTWFLTRDEFFSVAISQFFILSITVLTTAMFFSENGTNLMRKILGGSYSGLKFITAVFLVFVPYSFLPGVRHQLEVFRQMATNNSSVIQSHFFLLSHPSFLLFLCSVPYAFLWYLDTRSEERVMFRDFVILFYFFSAMRLFGISWISEDFSAFLGSSKTIYIHLFFNLWFFAILPLSVFSLARGLVKFQPQLLRKPKKRDLWAYILGLLYLSIFFIVVGVSETKIIPSLFLVKFVYVFISVLAQELLFRGYILSFIVYKLSERWKYIPSAIAGLLIMSTLYGWIHYHVHGLDGAVGTGIAGLIIGIIFLRTRNLIFPIILHSTTVMMYAQVPFLVR